MTHTGRRPVADAVNRGFDRLERRWAAVLGWRDRHSFAFVPLLCAVVFGATAAGLSSWEWVHVRGKPVEHAEFVSWWPTGGVARCGKHEWGDVYELDWSSSDPPPGLPATFTSKRRCDHARSGEVVDVVRTVDRNGTVHVWEDPVTSPAYVGVITVGVALLGFVIGLIAALAQLAWARLRPRFLRPKHAAGHEA